MGVLRAPPARPPAGRWEPRGGAGRGAQRAAPLRGLDRVAHLLPCGPQGKIAIGQGAYRNKGALSPIFVVFSRKKTEMCSRAFLYPEVFFLLP